MNCTANLLSEAQADIAELWAKVEERSALIKRLNDTLRKYELREIQRLPMSEAREFYLAEFKHEFEAAKAERDALRAQLETKTSYQIWGHQPTESRAEIEARVKEECAQICEKSSVLGGSRHDWTALAVQAQLINAIRASKPTATNLEQAGELEPAGPEDQAIYKSMADNYSGQGKAEGYAGEEHGL